MGIPIIDPAGIAPIVTMVMDGTTRGILIRGITTRGILIPMHMAITMVSGMVIGMGIITITTMDIIGMSHMPHRTIIMASDVDVVAAMEQ